MRYVPYGPELDSVPNVIVDGRSNDTTVLSLSRRPGNQTPAELKADTSAEIVLNVLRSPKREDYLRDAQAISNDHYDIDGLLSLWAMLDPEAAIQRADLLVAVAVCAEFERWTGEQATKITCALRGLETLPSSAIHAAAADLDDGERAASFYREMLALLPRLFDDIGSFSEYWRDEFDAVVTDRGLFASGDATVSEIPELDLAIFQVPRVLHSMALYEQTDCTRVVLASEEHYYEVRYRYESWVELQSRRPLPRIDLRPFAEMLETFEGSPGEWVADDVSRTRPRLWLRDPNDGGSEFSSLTPGLFVRFFAAYLRDNAANSDLHWSPRSADQT